MATLAEIRQQYPQYGDLSDTQLADALYKTHYSDMPRDKFDTSIGYKATNRPTSQALGFDEGLTRPIDNMATAMDKGLSAVGIPMAKIERFFGEKPTADINAEHQAQFREQERTRKPGAVGSFAGSALGTAPATLYTRNPVVAGGLQGALMSKGKTAGDVALDTGEGALFSYLGGKAVNALAHWVKPVVDPAVKALKEAGVELTPGMVNGAKRMAQEDRAVSRPVVGGAIAADRQATLVTFNTATANRILEPLGVKVPAAVKPGFDTVGFAHDTVSDAYDKVIPKLSVALDPQAFVAKIVPAAQNLKTAQREHLQQIISNQLGNGQLQGRALKNAQGELRRLAGTFVKDPNADNQELGRALWHVDDELSAQMMAQNPKYAPDLQKANQAFRGLAILEDAASRADNGVVNTGGLKQAVRRADPSRRKADSGRGLAFLQDWSNTARNIIPAITPDSGTAGRVQSGNILANVKGVADLVGYRANKALDRLTLAKRPDWAEPVSDFLLRLRHPAEAAAVPATKGSRD
jgi:hypothetical protein